MNIRLLVNKFTVQADDSAIDKDEEQVGYVDEEESVIYDDSVEDIAGTSEDEKGGVEVDLENEAELGVDEEAKLAKAGMDKEGNGKYAGDIGNGEDISESPLGG